MIRENKAAILNQILVCPCFAVKVKLLTNNSNISIVFWNKINQKRNNRKHKRRISFHILYFCSWRSDTLHRTDQEVTVGHTAGATDGSDDGKRTQNTYNLSFLKRKTEWLDIG